MAAINKTKGSPKIQAGRVHMFAGDVMCPYCNKIHFTCIHYDVVPGKVQCRKCKRIFEITEPVAKSCNRINRNMRKK
jgi:hypothetical protein